MDERRIRKRDRGLRQFGRGGVCAGWSGRRGWRVCVRLPAANSLADPIAHSIRIPNTICVSHAIRIVHYISLSHTVPLADTLADTDGLIHQKSFAQSHQFPDPFQFSFTVSLGIGVTIAYAMAFTHRTKVRSHLAPALAG